MFPFQWHKYWKWQTMVIGVLNGQHTADDFENERVAGVIFATPYDSSQEEISDTEDDGLMPDLQTQFTYDLSDDETSEYEDDNSIAPYQFLQLDNNLVNNETIPDSPTVLCQLFPSYTSPTTAGTIVKGQITHPHFPTMELLP